MTVRRPSFLRHLLPLFALGALALPGHAETTGTLDTTFSGDGMAVDFMAGASATSAIAVTSAGIVVAGTENNGGPRLRLTRYLTNGDTDFPFQINPPTGYRFVANGTTIGSQPTAVALTILANGSPVLACLADSDATPGTYVIVLARVTITNSVPTLDTSFDSDGLAVIALPNSMKAVTGIIQNGSSFVVCGQANNGSRDVFTLVGCTSGGALDTNFNSGGSTPGILQPALGDAPATPSAATAIGVQSSGKFVIAGWALNNASRKLMAAIRCSTTGVVDTTFASSGVRLQAVGDGDASAAALTVQSDDRIALAGKGLITGSANDVMAVLRLDSTGAVDTSFGSSGARLNAIGTGSAYAQAIGQQSNGRLVVAGFATNGSSTGFTITRYSASGDLDTTVGSNGAAIFNTGSASAGALALTGTSAYVTGGGTKNSTPTFTTLRVTMATTNIDTGSEPDNSGSPYINTSCGLGSGISLGGLLLLGFLLRLRRR